MIIVHGFQPLTIITKRSILDVAAVLCPDNAKTIHHHHHHHHHHHRHRHHLKIKESSFSTEVNLEI